jgi:HrpA-like RNA helicase
MSTLPTMLRKGFIVPPKGSTEKDKISIKDTITVDYILAKISNMIPISSREFIIKKYVASYGDRVIVLKSETGSGKSTVLPVKLYTSFFTRTNRNIAVTQPRVLTAIDIPKSIPIYNPELKLGKNIGYSTKSFKNIPSQKGIIFATVGIIVQELLTLQDEAFMKKYQFIIIDEVDQRSLEIDQCLFLLKKFLKNNYKHAGCPLVILMSATINETVFMKYFEVPKENYIQVIGSTFPIEMHFPDYSVLDYIKYASLKAQKLHLDNIDDLVPGNTFRDIIIFVKDAGTGRKIYDDMHIFNSEILSKSEDIIIKYHNQLEPMLNNLTKSGGNPVVDYNQKYIIPILLDSSIFAKGGKDYKDLSSDIDLVNTPLWNNYLTGDISTHVKPTRRIIIITNLAETGVTIDTLKYCIDTGLKLNSEFYPDYNCKALMSTNITHVSAIQRRGRVGRKSPGQFYPCYTKETFDSLAKDELPTIIIDDITDILLTILIREKNTNLLQETNYERIKNNKNESNIFQQHLKFSNDWYTVKNELNVDVTKLDLIESPSIQSMSYSYEKLYILGFIDQNYNITDTGFFADKIRFIPMELRKLILSGFYYEANIMDLITIVAFTYVMRNKVFTKDFKLENFMKVNDTEFQFYNQILIADDFINCIFVWNIFLGFIEKTVKTMQFAKVKDWCLKSNIKVDGLISVIRTRDDIIENLIDIGINPYFNGLGLPYPTYNLNKILTGSLADGLSEIKKIKYCLYEGLKCNLLKHDKFTTYTSVFKNVPVKVKSAVVKELNEVEQQFPKYVVCNSYMLSQKFGSEQYQFIADGFCSVLDNFVVVDEKFFLN